MECSMNVETIIHSISPKMSASWWPAGEGRHPAFRFAIQEPLGVVCFGELNDLCEVDYIVRLNPTWRLGQDLESDKSLEEALSCLEAMIADHASQLIEPAKKYIKNYLDFSNELANIQVVQYRYPLKLLRHSFGWDIICPVALVAQPLI